MLCISLIAAIEKKTPDDANLILTLQQHCLYGDELFLVFLLLNSHLEHKASLF